MVKTGDSNSQRSCSVPQCKSRGNEIALFHFPKDESLRKKWTDAIQIEKRVSPGMQVCSRHFVKNDYIFPDITSTTKVRRLKKTAVPSQNLPWQFPNKHVSPALAKARMERLKNRQQQRGSATSERKIEADTKKVPEAVRSSLIKDDSSLIYEDEVDPLLKELVKQENNSDSDKSNIAENEADELIQKTEKKIDNKVSDAKKPVSVSISDRTGDKLQVVSLSSGNNKKTVEKKMVIHMRARAPTRLRHRKGVLKCELCGRKCLTPQALRTHQLIAHKNTRSNRSSPDIKSPAVKKPKETPKASPVSLSSDKLRELLSPKEKEKSLNESSIEKNLQDFDSDAMDTDFSSESELEREAQQTKPGKKDKIKTEFECPKCRRRFAVYFSAFRHIQKHHPGVQQKSASGLTSTLKPARIEICTVCNLALSGDVHVCGGPLKLAVGFFCTGCNQEFKSLTLFDMHKSGMHSEGVESMFFPTLDEFENWKYRMENQTKVRYTVLDQNDTKKIHRCTHLTTFGSGNQSRSRMCPSSIIVQEFAKGFQVHYYPNHFGHNSETYALSSVFKKYSIASLMSLGNTNTNTNTNTIKQPQPAQVNSPAQPKNNSEDLIGETDLYLQFKKLTELLVNEAAKINVNGLKKITRKVLEIVPIIASYLEDDEDDMSCKLPPKQDTEDLQGQINKAFQSFKKKEPRKRKSVDVDTLLVKRSKPVFQSTENTLKEQRSKAQVRKSAPVLKLKEEKEITLDKKESNRENVKLDMKKEKAPVSIQKSFNQSPSFIDQYQEFVGKTMVSKAADKKKPKAEPKKKVVKVKIGQFKPSPLKKVSSPKNSSPKTDTESSSRNSISNVKEIRYEVKEQENDCNILILKI